MRRMAPFPAMNEVLTSAGLGAAIGAAYAAGSLATARWALRHEGQRFLLVFFGGLLARLALALVLVILVLALLDVHVPVFIGTLFFIFLLGLTAEVWTIHRRERDR